MKLIILLQFFIELVSQYQILEDIYLKSVQKYEMSISIIKVPSYNDRDLMDLTIDYNISQPLSILIFFELNNLITHSETNMTVGSSSKQKILFQLTQLYGSMTIPQSEIGINYICKLQINSESPANLQFRAYYSITQNRILNQHRQEHGVLGNNSKLTYNFDMTYIKSGISQVTLTNLQGISKLKQYKTEMAYDNYFELEYYQSACIFEAKEKCRKSFFIQCASEYCQYSFTIDHISFNKSISISYGEIINFSLENQEQYLIMKQNQFSYFLVTCNEQIEYFCQDQVYDQKNKSKEIRFPHHNKDLEVLLYSKQQNQFHCKYEVQSQIIFLNSIVSVEQIENSYQYFSFNSDLNVIKIELIWEENLIDEGIFIQLSISTVKDLSSPSYNEIMEQKFSQENEVLVKTNTTYLHLLIFVNSYLNYFLRIYDPADDIIPIDSSKTRALCPRCAIRFEYLSTNVRAIYLSTNVTNDILFVIVLVNNLKELKLQNLDDKKQLYFFEAQSNTNYTIQLLSISNKVHYPELTINSIVKPPFPYLVLLQDQKYMIDANIKVIYILNELIKYNTYFVFVKPIDLKTITLKTILNNQNIRLKQIKSNIVKIELEFQEEADAIIFSLYKTGDRVVFKFFQFSEQSIQNSLITQAFIYEPQLIRKQNDLIFQIQPFSENIVNNLKYSKYQIVVRYYQSSSFSNIQSNLICLFQQVQQKLMDDVNYEIKIQTFECSGAGTECLIIQQQLIETCYHQEIQIQLKFDQGPQMVQIYSEIYKLNRNMGQLYYFGIVIIFICLLLLFIKTKKIHYKQMKILRSPEESSKECF